MTFDHHAAMWDIATADLQAEHHQAALAHALADLSGVRDFTHLAADAAEYGHRAALTADRVRVVAVAHGTTPKAVQDALDASFGHILQARRAAAATAPPQPPKASAPPRPPAPAPDGQPGAEGAPTAEPAVTAKSSKPRTLPSGGTPPVPPMPPAAAPQPAAPAASRVAGRGGEDPRWAEAQQTAQRISDASPEHGHQIDQFHREHAAGHMMGFCTKCPGTFEINGGSSRFSDWRGVRDWDARTPRCTDENAEQDRYRARRQRFDEATTPSPEDLARARARSQRFDEATAPRRASIEADIAALNPHLPRETVRRLASRALRHLASDPLAFNNWEHTSDGPLTDKVKNFDPARGDAPTTDGTGEGTAPAAGAAEDAAKTLLATASAP